VASSATVLGDLLFDAAAGSTLTATSRPSCSVARCTWAIDGACHGFALERGEHGFDFSPSPCSISATARRMERAAPAVLQLGELVRDIERHEVAVASTRTWPKLDVNRTQGLERLAQAPSAAARRCAAPPAARADCAQSAG